MQVVIHNLFFHENNILTGLLLINIWKPFVSIIKCPQKSRGVANEATYFFGLLHNSFCFLGSGRLSLPFQEQLSGSCLRHQT